MWHRTRVARPRRFTGWSVTALVTPAVAGAQIAGVPIGTQRSASTHDRGTVDRFEISNPPVAGTNYRNGSKPLAIAGDATNGGALAVQRTGGGAWTPSGGTNQRWQLVAA